LPLSGCFVITDERDVAKLTQREAAFLECSLSTIYDDGVYVETGNDINRI